MPSGSCQLQLREGAAGAEGVSGIPPRRRPEKRHNLFGQRVDAAAVEARLERQAQAGKEGQWNAEEHGEADTLVGMYQQDFYQHLKGGQVCNRYGKLCKWDVDGRLESVVPPGVSELAPRSATLIMLQHPVEVVMCSWVGVMDDRQAILISWYHLRLSHPMAHNLLENQHSVKSFTTVDRPVFLLQIDDDDDPGISIAIRAKSFSLSNLVKDGPAGSAQAGQVPMVWGDARKYRSNDGLQIVSAPVDGREWQAPQLHPTIPPPKWGNGSYLIPADVLTAQHHLPLPPYSVLRVVGPELKAEHEFILTRPNEGL
eukprot:gene7351-8747_t